MNLSIPAFRITADELPDADKKFQRAISPLLEALNLSLNSIVTTFNALVVPFAKSSRFTTDSTGAATTTIAGLDVTPTEVWLTKLVPADGSSISALYAMAAVPKSSGASLSFFGLAANKTYNFTVRYS